MAPRMYRQGDILLVEVTAKSTAQNIRTRSKRRTNNVLAYGEVTGHSHKATGNGVSVLESLGNRLFVEVTKTADIVHEEHKPITLPKGLFEVRHQVEYTPEKIRRVVD